MFPAGKKVSSTPGCLFVKLSVGSVLNIYRWAKAENGVRLKKTKQKQPTQKNRFTKSITQLLPAIKPAAVCLFTDNFYIVTFDRIHI